jgi:hypothetical protein
LITEDYFIGFISQKKKILVLCNDLMVEITNNRLKKVFRFIEKMILLELQFNKHRVKRGRGVLI